ncbi:uncharacterized protein LOC144026910 isoform X2 [Festucalex cinctus]
MSGCCLSYGFGSPADGSSAPPKSTTIRRRNTRKMQSSFWEGESRPPEEETAVPDLRDILAEHDYSVPYDPALVDEENTTVQELDGNWIEKFGIHKFASSDKDIRFFTRFASFDLLMRFWALIEPALPFMAKFRLAQGGMLNEGSSDGRALHPIEECFMFLNYLALGSELQDLADRYRVHQATVCRVIISWSNFLYTILGSVRIWIPQEQIQKHMPAVFEDYSDTTVILTCSELMCQTPSLPILPREVISQYVSHATLKGLIGLAPHGAVTFVSELYTGLIIDKQIVRESGLRSLLKPEMAVMVDKDFIIDDILPCRIYRPAFLFEKSQTSASDLRVHVERSIRRVKERKLFESEFPIHLFGSINQIYTVACLLVNYENGPFVESMSEEDNLDDKLSLQASVLEA